jgi:hypothetical protein
MRLSTLSTLALAALITATGCRSSSGYESPVYASSGSVSSSPSGVSAGAVITAPTPEPARIAVAKEPPAPAATTTAEPAVSVSSNAFDSPEAAMLAVAQAAESRDHDRIVAIFGEGCHDMIGAHEDSDNEDDCLRVAAMIRERLVFEDQGAGRKVAVIGNDQWRFPVPIEKVDRGFAFDVDGGREEIVSREVGRNEILTVDVLEDFAEAQREYAAENREGNSHAYAERFASSDGKHDGLYWKAANGAKPSPLGPHLAAAAAEPSGDSAPTPFNGYFFTMLHGERRAVAESRPDGAAKVEHTEGCGALAWPAEYGVSGVMTFMVNQSGVVFEKDLGPSTGEQVKTVTAYGPDATWQPTKR